MMLDDFLCVDLTNKGRLQALPDYASVVNMSTNVFIVFLVVFLSFLFWGGRGLGELREVSGNDKQHFEELIGQYRIRKTIRVGEDT